MSVEALGAVISRIVEDLEGISVASGYHFDIGPTRVNKGFLAFNDVQRFPFICVGYARAERSTQRDQITYDVPLTIELYGYVKKVGGVLDEAFDLASDIERALYADETLGDYVWDMSLSFEIGTLGDIGVVSVGISAMSSYVK